jgi:CMP-N-acetylneuraminic acid synthetase
VGQLHTNWELIIVNEGSEDDTQTIAERYLALHPDRVRVLRNDTPVGLQKVANTVLGLANGKYLMRLDADDWLDESALLLMTAKLESDPQFGLVYGNFYYVDEDGRYLGTERRRKFGIEDTSGHMPPHGACTMVNTRALKAAGGYSEDVNAQDGWDLWYRMQSRVKVAHLDAALFYYRQHGKSLSRDSGRLLDARAEILRNARQRLDGGYTPTCLAVIPVKEDYPGWEGVPYQEFAGRSLLERALDSALDAPGVSDVAISTQSRKVLDYSLDIEARSGRQHLRILRPDVPESTFDPLKILRQAAESYQVQRGTYPDIVLFLSLHAPARKPEHIGRAIDVLIVTNSDSVVSVTQEREPMFGHGKNGLELLNPGRFEGLEYEKENLYRFNGSVIGTWFSNLRQGSLFGESIAHIELSRSESMQVKTRDDLERYAPGMRQHNHS